MICGKTAAAIARPVQMLRSLVFLIMFSVYFLDLSTSPALAQETAVAPVQGWVGVELRSPTRKEIAAAGSWFRQGPIVVEVKKDSPAAKAHLAPGDVVLAVNKHAVANAKEFFAAIAGKAPGEAHRLDVLRRGGMKVAILRLDAPPGAIQTPVAAASVEAPVMAPQVQSPPQSPPTTEPNSQSSESNPPPLPAAPASPPPSPAKPFSGPPATRGYFGGRAKRVTQGDAEKLGWSAPKGLKINDIAKNSPAAAAGISDGSIILSFNGQPVDKAYKLRELISRAPGATVHLRVVDTAGRETEVTATLGARPEQPGEGNPLRLMLDTGGHTAPAVDVAFTPDGKQLVSASNDKTIRVWDVEQGATVRIIRGEAGTARTGALYAMALSPDGRWLATGGYLHDGDVDVISSVRLYDFATGELAALLMGHEDVVRALAFSPDGKRLISGGADNTAVVWDVEQKRQIQHLVGHSTPVISVAFSRDGTRAVTGGEDETLRLWNVADGRMTAEMTEHRERARPKDGEQKILKGDVRSIAVSPTEDLIASGDANGFILLSDSVTGKFLRVLASPRGMLGAAGIDGLSFSPDGRWLHAASQEEGCLVLETATGSEQYEGKLRPKLVSKYDGAKRAQCNGRSTSSPDGKLIATIYNNQILLIDPMSSKTIKTLDSTGKTDFGVGFSQDGRAIAWGTTPGSISEQSSTGLTRLLRLPLDGAPLTGVEEIGANGTATFVQGSSTHGTKSLKYKSAGPGLATPGVIQIEENGRWKSEFECGSGPGEVIDPLVFAPDGEEVVSTEFGEIVLHDLQGRETGRLTGHEGKVRAIAPSPDGRFLLSAGADKTVRLWNRKSHDLIVTLFAGRDGEWVMWTPQGFYASSPGGDAMLGWQINRGPEKTPDYTASGQLRKHLNRPDIVTRAIQLASAVEAVKEANGAAFRLEDLLSQPVPSIRILAPAPGATVQGGKTEIEVLLAPTPDPIKRLRVQVNGAQIAELMPENGAGFDPGVHKLRVPLARGRNVIHIAAANNTGETPATLVLHHDGEGQLDKLGTLHILAIGVDKYPNLPNADLHYSGADARAFADTMERRTGLLHQKVVKRVLANGGAPADAPTKTNIENALGALANASENDTIMVFLAGHGFNQGPSYRFLPTDAASADGRFVPASVVPWYAFQEAIENARGRRILFLDTCHAGNAYNPTLTNQAFHANIVVYSAARWDQSALERDDLGGGHGLFTYSLIEGVDGGAKNTEGEISTISLRDFLLRRVKELAAPFNQQQNPQFFQGRDAQDYVLSRM